MAQEYSPLEVRVSGDFACFTRPEMKVERVSYSVMTPSAARGVLEAIFWKPEAFWTIEEIWVLKEIRNFSIQRNEVKHRASERTAAGWREHGGGYDASDSDNRAQRHTLGLREVDYLIRARIETRPGIDQDPAKYRDQFRRRVRNGRCFTQPYLGCREFAAAFAPPDGSERPIDRTENLGLMLLDLDYLTDGSGRGTPRFFDARLDKGILRVPTRPPLVED